MSDSILPANTDTCLVEFDKKEYAIVGDLFFAKTIEEVPPWFQELVQDTVVQVNGNTYDTLAQYNISLLAALQGIEVSKNTYEQYINKLITDQEAFVSVLTTLNSTINDNDATIRQLLLTYATEDFAVASAAQLLTASINGGAISALIGSVETAMATQYGAMAQRLNMLESTFDDVAGQQSANATAIQGLTTYTGYGVYNGADALIANSNFYSNLNAYLDGTDYNIGGSSTLLQDVTVVSIEKMKQVEAKFEYGSTIELDGKTYNAGFGLVQTGTLLPDGTTYDSEFWVRANRFKFVNDTGGVMTTPFQVVGNTVLVGWDAVTGSNRPADGATRNVNRGEWVQYPTNPNYYMRGDFVQYNGSSYTCTVSTLPGSASPLPTNTSYWTLLASQGLSGINKAVVSIYYKNNSSTVAPTAAISGTFTYTFSTNTLSGGTFNGWSTTLPTAVNGEYIWVKQATASSLTDIDTITYTEFSGATCLSGVGVNGLNSATVYLYAVNTSNVTPPSAFSGTFTYTFSSGLLSGGTLNGWSQTVPTIPKGSYLWVRQATATSIGTTDVVTSSEFSSAVVISGVGADGNTGATGSRGASTANKTVTTALSSYTAYDSDFAAVTGFSDRVKGDTLIVTSSHSTDGGTKTWIRNAAGSTSWTDYAWAVNGNALITGTLTASRIKVGHIGAVYVDTSPPNTLVTALATVFTEPATNTGTKVVELVYTNLSDVPVTVLVSALGRTGFQSTIGQDVGYLTFYIVQDNVKKYYLGWTPAWQDSKVAAVSCTVAASTTSTFKVEMWRSNDAAHTTYNLYADINLSLIGVAD